jgi:hypothetical protein
MPKDKESEIRYRLKILSQIEPSPETSEATVQKVKDTLEKTQGSSGTRIRRPFYNTSILKFASAAVLLIGFGFIAGRLAAPEQPDMQEIQELVDTRLEKFAEQTLAASGTLIDLRLGEMIGLVEAARENDRKWIAAALNKLEYDRRADTDRLGNSLVTLAAQTNELHKYEQN